MTYVQSYAQMTTTVVPAAIWDEAWFALQSWKGHLQNHPGFQAVHIGARRLENDDVWLVTTVTWEYIEQLEEWASNRWASPWLLASLDDPPETIESVVYETLG